MTGKDGLIRAGRNRLAVRALARINMEIDTLQVLNLFRSLTTPKFGRACSVFSLPQADEELIRNKQCRIDTRIRNTRDIHSNDEWRNW